MRGSADELNNQVDIVIGNNGHGIRGEHTFRHRDTTIGLNIQIGNPGHNRNDAGPLGHQSPVFLDAFHYAGTDGAESKYSNPDFLHNLFLFVKK